MQSRSLLNTKHYKVRIKGKVEQSREWSSTLQYREGCYSREPLDHPQLRLPTYICVCVCVCMCVYIYIYIYKVYVCIDI